MILRARQVLPMTTPPIEDGAVVIGRDRIAAIGAYSDIRTRYRGETRDLGDAVLLPGLINAHCHLDYTDMRGRVPWRGDFMAWLAQITEMKRQWEDAQYVASVTHGLEQLAQTGTSTVINIECLPRIVPRLPATPVRVWWCPELIDLTWNEETQRRAEERFAWVEAQSHAGLSPHAPYTVAGPLYRLCAERARASGWLLTTHVAESVEEVDMFRRGSGPMFDFFSRIGRNMEDCKRVGPLQWLAEYGVLGPNCLLAHANHLTPQEIAFVAESGAYVVHCPRSHQFFERGVPRLESLWREGICVCLGTDSLASNESLDMLAEVRTLARMFPGVTAAKVLAMATVHPAKALNQTGKLGTLSPGAWADVIALPLEDVEDDPYEGVVHTESPVQFCMMNGKVVRG